MAEKKRLEKTRQLLKEHDIDVFYISSPVNRRYLSGFTGSAGALLVSADRALIVTDFRYIDQAGSQAPLFEAKRWKDDFYRCLSGLIKDNGWEKVGFESEQVVYSVYSEMKKKIEASLVPLKDAILKQRMVKDQNELEILRSGAKTLDLAFDYILSKVRPGMTEKELALELEIFLLKQGAEETSFRFIVASGQRGSLPHGTATEKVINEGEMVTLDFGAVFAGYATDMTRTFALGKTNQRQVEIYDIVYNAQQKARAALKPGLQGREIDAVARDLITGAGYGSHFGHGLGHGVGLETHEQPVLNHLSETVLEPGMVVTVEPGVYLPGWGGVRIEDMLCVTENGSETLTNSPRELIVI